MAFFTKNKQLELKPIQSQHLTLVPLRLELVEAAMKDRAQLEKLLEAQVPDEWPNVDFGEVLPIIAQSLSRKLALAEWDRLIIHRADNILIGDVGLKGGPDKAGTADLGYGVIPSYRRKGYAFEAAQALVQWAFNEKRLKRITADCFDDNRGSIRVLEKLGMRRLAPEGNLLRWELDPAASFNEKL